MTRGRIGRLPRRYAFILNPHAGTRLSKCPSCDKPTHHRKFVLFIHTDQQGPIALGKTCRYCSRCELIMAHQDELKAELARALGQSSADAVGDDFMVLGTVEKSVWKEGLAGKAPTLEDALSHVADFTDHFELGYDPGGWAPTRERSSKGRGQNA